MEGHIAPDNLLGLVRNTVPYLFDGMARHPSVADRPLLEAGDHSLGYLEILQGAGRVETVEEYFAFCLACHHATVGTFVPTDVDSKIRGILWRQARGAAAERMFDFTLRSMQWSIDGLSRRYTVIGGHGPVSGHNGEQLSVLAGALGSFLTLRDGDRAGRAAEAIDRELNREAAALRQAQSMPGREIDVLCLAAALTHNVGDLDQGISFWPAGANHKPMRERFARLAHENAAPYGGAYQSAARIYRKAMSPEGHRNYPLRGVKALRQSPDLLMPWGPFLDEWGALVARHPALSDPDRAEVLAALLQGCRTLAGQRGYYRAMAGMAESLGTRMEAVARLMPGKARSDWKDPEVRKAVAVPRHSFESMMRKMARSDIG